MGTEVHYSMFLPERYSVRDLTENPRSSNWSLYEEKKTPHRGQCQGTVSIGATLNGYHGCDKEKLRETILKHESIFRHQVFELHRLYRRQRDLMNSLKSKVQEHALETKATQSSHFSSQIYSMVDQMRWPPSGSPLADPYSGTQLNSDSHVSHAKGKITQSSFQENEVKMIDDSLESDCKKVRRRLFGLELPSDDNHVDEQKGYFSSSIRESCHPNGNKMVNSEILFLQVDKNSNNNGRALRSELHAKRNLGFLNLNDPIDHVEEIYFSASADTLLNNDCFLQKMLSQSAYKNANSGETRNCRYSVVGSRTAEDSSILEPAHGETNTITDSMPLIQKQGEQKKSKLFGVEISECNHEGSLTSCVPDQNIYHSYNSEGDMTGSSHISFQLNSGSGPSMSNPVVVKEGLLVNGFSGSDSNETRACKAPGSLRYVKCSNEVTASEQFVEHDIRKTQMDTGCVVDALSFKDLNASSALQNKNQDKVVGPKKFASEDRQNRTDDTLHWFRTMPHSNGSPSDGSQHPYQMNLESLHERFQKLYNKGDKHKKDPMENPIQDCSSATLPHNSWDKVKVNECSSKKITQYHVSSESHSLKPETSLKSTLKPDFLAASTGVGNSIIDDSRKSDMADNGMDLEFGGQFSLQSSAGQGLIDKSSRRFTIDLNHSFDEETQSTVNSPILKLGCREDLVGPTVQTYGAAYTGVEYLQEECVLVDSSAALIEFAAEALVNISFSLVNNHQDLSATHETDASMDSLYWFAEVATSHKGDIQTETSDASLGKNKSCPNDSNPEELDDFEFMTLNLKETKTEEFCYKPPISLSENASDETTLQKRTRRGQTRRGRQKKDFQRDVLPSLTSLSRNEVTDDIITIEELVKSSGGSWQSSLTLKSRNAKGRGRKRSVAATATEVCQPQTTQPISEELVLEECNLTGWGKRTRRPPRQRYLIPNHSIPIK